MLSGEQYNNTGRIISYAGDIDFIIERTRDIAWIGDIMKFLINPIVHLCLIIFGFVWLYVITKTPTIKEELLELPKEKEQLAEKEKPLVKIKLHSIRQKSSHENVGGELMPKNPILETKITIIPNQPMQFAELYLRIEGQRIKPLGKPIYVSTLDLPYIIKGGETHNVRFELPLKFIDEKYRKANIIVLIGGQKWKSEGIEVAFG